MKTIYVTFSLITMLTLLGVSVLAHAEKSSSKSKQKSALSSYKAKSSNLKTNIQFGDSTIRGQRQRPLGASTEIESEKSIPNLIDYRENFNDRIKQSKSAESL